jgi:hypothetical protein
LTRIRQYSPVRLFISQEQLCFSGAYLYKVHTHRPTGNFSVICLFSKNEIDPCGFAYAIRKIFSIMTSYTEWGYVFHRTLQNVEIGLGEVARTCSNWSKAYFTPFHAIAVNREQKIISTHVHASTTPSECPHLHTTGEIKFYKNPCVWPYITRDIAKPERRLPSLSRR